MTIQFRDPVIQIRGRNVIYIENYKKLVCYTCQIIRVMAFNSVIEITGDYLQIRYYSREDLEISGLISSVCFIE